MSVRIYNNPGTACPLFGNVNPPVIEGFTIFPRSGQWLCATDGERHYIVCASDNAWAFFEVEYRREFMKPRSNPSGLHMKRDGLKLTEADFLIDRSRYVEPMAA